MKRRQRGLSIADTVPGSVAGELVRGSESADRAMAAATRRMYRARESRDGNVQRVRSMAAEVETARRRAEAVVVEQAERTAELRRALVESRGRVMELEQEIADGAVSNEVDLVTSLRARLAAGNEAYSELMEVHSRLRAAFDREHEVAKTISTVVRDWDLLCRRLYKASRGRQISSQDREVLHQWSTWRTARKEGTK